MKLEDVRDMGEMEEADWLWPPPKGNSSRREEDRRFFHKDLVSLGSDPIWQVEEQ